MTKSLTRRSWLQKTAMAAAVLPVSAWYDPFRSFSSYYTNEQLYASGAIRLNLNENAYGPGDKAKKAIVDSLSEANRYPRQFIADLKKAIAQKEGLTTDHVLVTAGSTELLGLAGLYFGLHGGELLACHPTFDFLMEYAQRLGCKWAKTPVDNNFQYDLHALSHLAGKNTRLIFICNPNNPTGIEIPHQELRSFCEAHASKYPVYIDEAYIELSQGGKETSTVNLLHDLPKLVIGRTFSKVHGLAGMRIGYALAHPDIIKGLNDLHIGRSITLSSAGAAAALASLEDQAFEQFSREKIMEGRNMVAKAFDKWNVTYLPSATNFVFFKNDKFAVDPVKSLANDNIFLRNYDDVPGWSRVSIGTLEEMNVFINAAGRYLA